MEQKDLNEILYKSSRIAECLYEISKKWDKLNDDEQNSLSRLIVGTKNMTNFCTLMNQYNNK